MGGTPSGDKVADIQAAPAARFAFGVQVLTGYGREHETASSGVASAKFPVHVVTKRWPRPHRCSRHLHEIAGGVAKECKEFP